jgi:hypothetical protein
MAQHGRGRPTTRLLEFECPSIDLRRLLDHCRRMGSSEGILCWVDPGTGRDGGRMTFRLESGHVGPILRVAYGNADQPIVQDIWLQTTRPHYGGRRWWFSCPMARENGQRCNRRVAKLYLPKGRELGCRACHSLVYRSSRESHKWDLLIRRAGWSVPEGLDLIRQAIRRNPSRSKRRAKAYSHVRAIR